MTTAIQRNKRNRLLVFCFPLLTAVLISITGRRDVIPGQRLAAQAGTMFTAKSPLLSTTIPARQWQPALNLLLVTLKIKINNFTSVDFQDTSSNDFRWYKRDGCVFQIGNRSQLIRSTFSLLPERREPMTIYLNDINKQKAMVSADKGRIKIRVDFEETGTEIRTNCVDNFVCGGTGNPNFNVEDPALEIYLRPSITDGKLSYSKAESVLHGRLNHEGFNITVSILQEIIKLCNQNLDSSFQKMGQDFIDKYLNDPDVKKDITSKLNLNLERARAHGFSFPANMRSIMINPAGDMVITHE